MEPLLLTDFSYCRLTIFLQNAKIKYKILEGAHGGRSG
jgi:hypothetical protein